MESKVLNNTTAWLISYRTNTPVNAATLVVATFLYGNFLHHRIDTACMCTVQEFYWASIVQYSDIVIKIMFEEAQIT